MNNTPWDNGFAIAAGADSSVTFNPGANWGLVGKVYLGGCYGTARLYELDPVSGAIKQVALMTSDVWTDGKPTTDPFLYPGSAFLLPFAGHKGYGIALMIENLAGILTGTGAMYDLINWIDGPKDVPTHHGGAFLAFNVGAIASQDFFKNRVDA